MKVLAKIKLPDKIDVSMPVLKLPLSTWYGEEYDGDYVVTPKVERQTLSTRGKVLSEDITIEEIPYAEVSNNANGTTVTIA